MYVNFAAKITREENERISSKFEEEKESNKRFRGEFGKTNERQNRICVRVCVCACTCPLFRSEARKTLVGRWTAAYKVPVPPIRKDSKVLRRIMERLHKFTFVPRAQKSKLHQTRTPLRSFPSFYAIYVRHKCT